MPNLQYLEASPILVPLIDAYQLREVRLVWYPWQISYVEQTILAIKSMTHNDIPFIASHDFFGLDACFNIVESVSRHLPHTRILRMRRIGQYNELQPLDNALISPITEYLSRFPGLVYFGMENRYRVMLGPPRSTADRAVAEAWGNACPTLEACCLSNSAWVKLNGAWTVAPLEQFYALMDTMHMEIRTPIMI
ncbi:hypothetical protein MVEN_01090300 [Mycena venus]|uniref:Uncharacterized protein n=1 Tax=Mycena venus TaxID=2733690 RepID=A0A8H6Y904_9AGAR|nr:hypothetical protein MVEN_01090300 [Mycena venus]